MRTLLIALVLVPFSLLLTACGDEGCTEPVTAYAVGKFEKGAASTVTITKFSVYGIGQEKDSAMVTGQTTLQTVDLLLNPNDTITKMDFRFVVDADTIRDTLTFFYTNKDFFLNIDCGCSIFHNVDSILHTANLIQEVEILNSNITNEKSPTFTIRY